MGLPAFFISVFTFLNAAERVLETGDLFKPVLGKGINMEMPIATFEGKEY